MRNIPNMHHMYNKKLIFPARLIYYSTVNPVCFLGQLSSWQLWDVTLTVSTSCWRKMQIRMLQINEALLHCTEL